MSNEYKHLGIKSNVQVYVFNPFSIATNGLCFYIFSVKGGVFIVEIVNVLYKDILWLWMVFES